MKQIIKKLTSKSSHSRKTSLQEKMSKGILCHYFAKSVVDSVAHKESVSGIGKCEKFCRWCSISPMWKNIKTGGLLD